MLYINVSQRGKPILNNGKAKADQKAKDIILGLLNYNFYGEEYATPRHCHFITWFK